MPTTNPRPDLTKDAVLAPEWIRVAQDGNGPNGGFWTCAAATETSPKYIRADIVAARIAQARAEEREACAEIADAVDAADELFAALKIASRIRARKETTND